MILLEDTDDTVSFRITVATEASMGFSWGRGLASLGVSAVILVCLEPRM